MLPYQNILPRPEQVTPSLKFIKAQKEPALKVMETNLKLKSNGTLWEKIMTQTLKIKQIKNSKDWYLVIKMLTELVKGNTVNRDCFSKEIENYILDNMKSLLWFVINPSNWSTTVNTKALFHRHATLGETQM